MPGIYVGQSAFAQILKYIRKNAIGEITSRHKSDSYVKKLSTHNNSFGSSE
jgi:hypothetical protein